MALNMATFRTRAATAGVFVAVMLLGLLTSPWTFFLLFTIIHFGCWVEYNRLARKIDPTFPGNTLLPYAAMGAGWFFMIYSSGLSFGGMSLSAVGRAGCLVMLAIVLLTGIIAFSREQNRSLGWVVFGLVYISGSLSAMVDLRMRGSVHAAEPLFHFAGYALPLGIFIALWINDTMAYLVGSFIGRTPFSPISPKKTWEGTGGGAILCVVTVALLGHWIRLYRLADWIAIGAIVAICGVAGDLFESKLKRMAGVKDSGSIMPGHGGFLDRFDSLLFAAPLAWLYVKLMM